MATADIKQGLSLVAIPTVSVLLTATTSTTLYTVPSNSTAQIATFSITNKTSSACVVSVSVVPSGGTVDGTHLVTSLYSVPANDSTIIREIIGGYLPAGSFIAATAGTANALCCVITGLVNS